MENKIFHKRLIFSLAAVLLTFSFVIICAFLIPTSYAKWQNGLSGEVSGQLTNGKWLYTVTYVKNGHGSDQPQLDNVKQLPSPLPTLSEDGWEFGGWYTDDVLTSEAVAGATITKDTTLYAKWTEKQQTPPDKPNDGNGGTVTPPKYGKGIIITDSTGKSERVIESNLPAATKNLQASITVKEGDLLWFYNENSLQDLNSNAFTWLEKVEGVTGCYKVVTGGTYSINYLPNTGLLN